MVRPISRQLSAAFAITCLAWPVTARAHPAVGIVMDRRGNVFFSDLSNVWRIAPDGSVSIAVAHVHSHELYLGPGDTLYGEHLWYNGDSVKTWGHRVWRRAPDGAVSDLIPPQAGFRTDFSFVRDRAGNHYWIQCEGTLSVGVRDPGGHVDHRNTGGVCIDPIWLWSDPSGVLFYADKGALKRIGTSGDVTTLATGLNGRSFTQVHVSEHLGVLGLWTDASGFVFIANYRGRQLLRVPAAGGAPQVVMTSPLLWGPTGGFSAPNGDLWILESSLWNSMRVRRIGTDGKVTVFPAKVR